MRCYAFAKRVAKEILRDPLNLCFGIGFPIVLLLLLSAIQANIPVSMFEIEVLAPGISVFGLSFMTLFSATLIAKDRASSFLSRLYTTPMRAIDFILGYTIPILPMALVQSIFCYAVGLLLGMEFTGYIPLTLLYHIPMSLFYIALGLLCGAVFTDKQVGGICGALLTNLSAWLSGIWFDLELVGGVFVKAANCLPFVHAVKLEQAAACGRFGEALPHLLWVTVYALLLLIAAVTVFLGKMKKGI